MTRPRMKILRHPAVAGSVRLFLLALLLTAALAGAFAVAPQSESAKPQNFAFANLLAAPAFAQEAAAQEAPVPSWVCRHIAPDVDLVCTASCMGGNGEHYLAVTPSGDETVVRWTCPDSSFFGRCDELAKCISGGFFGFAMTEEECVAEGYASSLTCNNRSHEVCSSEVQEATMARCNPPLAAPCESPLVPDHTFGRCRCPSSPHETHMEVDGACVLRPPPSLVTVFLSPVPIGGKVSVYYTIDGPDDGAEQTIGINDGDTVPQGTRVVYRAMANHGYYVSRFLGHCQDRIPPFPPLVSGDSRGCSSRVTENATYGVEFGRIWDVEVEWFEFLFARAGHVEVSGYPLARAFLPFFGEWRGAIVAGGTLTLAAQPVDEAYVSDWGNSECNNQGKGDPSRPGERIECVLTPNDHLSMYVSFALLPEMLGPTVFLLPTENGTLSANRDKDPVIEDGETVPEGATVRFQARPAEGYYASRWTGDCAGRTAGHSGRTGPSAVAGCGILDVTTNVTVGVEFARPRRVSLSHSAGGTLTARSLPGLNRIVGGGVVDDGATVSITATPDSGYEISMWSGDCDGTAKSEADCVLTATVHLSASVSFSDIDECATATHNCAADGGVCENTPGAFACECASDYSGDGFSCALEVRTVSLSHSPGGTLSAGWSGDAEVASGETVPYGAVVTFTATPADEIKISLWSGGCAGVAAAESVCVLTATVALDVAVEFFADCAGRFRAAGADAYSRCGDCLAEYGEMGGGHCVHLQDAPTENRMTCEEVFGGDWEAAGDSAGVCSGIDINDTFCFLGVADALPCQGLFLHVRDCNLKHNRPALDPWHCGKACANGKAVGAWCLGSE